MFVLSTFPDKHSWVRLDRFPHSLSHSRAHISCPKLTNSTVHYHLCAFRANNRKRHFSSDEKDGSSLTPPSLVYLLLLGHLFIVGSLAVWRTYHSQEQAYSEIIFGLEIEIANCGPCRSNFCVGARTALSVQARLFELTICSRAFGHGHGSRILISPTWRFVRELAASREVSLKGPEVYSACLLTLGRRPGKRRHRRPKGATQHAFSHKWIWPVEEGNSRKYGDGFKLLLGLAIRMFTLNILCRSPLLTNVQENLGLKSINLRAMSPNFKPRKQYTSVPSSQPHSAVQGYNKTGVLGLRIPRTAREPTTTKFLPGDLHCLHVKSRIMMPT